MPHEKQNKTWEGGEEGGIAGQRKARQSHGWGNLKILGNGNATETLPKIMGNTSTYRMGCGERKKGGYRQQGRSKVGGGKGSIILRTQDP